MTMRTFLPPALSGTSALLVATAADQLRQQRTYRPARQRAGWPVLSFGFGLLVFAGADRHSLIGRWRVPGAGWLAAVSYTLYLSHKIALHLCR